jgi:oxygen-independent coproporphyrinogen-3 oxidase
MYAMERDGTITMPDEDTEREMYYAGRNVMKKNGLNQYEISNFARHGFECRHNMKYWNQEEYIGFGPSAHSFLSRVRFSNGPDLKKYCTNAKDSKFERITQETLDEEAMMFEYIMLRLRLNEGLDADKFREKFSVGLFERYEEQIDHLKKNSLVEIDGNILRLTERGMDISNYVFGQFMQ